MNDVLRYEARDWKGILGKKRHFIVYDRQRGGVAVNAVIRGRRTFSQFESLTAAEQAAAALNETATPQPTRRRDRTP